jgi:ribosomal protein L40E
MTKYVCQKCGGPLRVEETEQQTVYYTFEDNSQQSGYMEESGCYDHVDDVLICLECFAENTDTGWLHKFNGEVYELFPAPEKE